MTISTRTKFSSITWCINEDIHGDVADRHQYVSILTKGVRFNKRVGYAGFNARTSLVQCVERQVFSDKKQSTGLYRTFHIGKKQVERSVREAIALCSRTLPHGRYPLNVFIFPTYVKAIQVDLRGVNGYTPWQDTIHLYLAPNYSLAAIKDTIAHEYNHALFFRERIPKTLADSLVFEGLAEVFREEVIGSRPPRFIHAILRKQQQPVFRAISKFLSSENERIRNVIFFGGDNHKQWTGYSIGYAIAKSFRKRNATLSWSAIMAIDPKTILEQSAFADKK